MLQGSIQFSDDADYNNFVSSLSEIERDVYCFHGMSKEIIVLSENLGSARKQCDLSDGLVSLAFVIKEWQTRNNDFLHNRSINSRTDKLPVHYNVEGALNQSEKECDTGSPSQSCYVGGVTCLQEDANNDAIARKYSVDTFSENSAIINGHERLFEKIISNKQPCLKQPGCVTTPHGQPELPPKPEYVSTPHGQPELCPKPEYATTPHGQPELCPTFEYVTTPHGQPELHPKSEYATRPHGQPELCPKPEYATTPLGQPKRYPKPEYVTTPHGQPELYPKPEYATTTHAQPELCPKPEYVATPHWQLELYPTSDYVTTPHGQPELHPKPDYVTTPHGQPELCPKPEYATTSHGQPELCSKPEYATTPHGQPELNLKQPEYVSTPNGEPELCPKPEYATTTHGQPELCPTPEYVATTHGQPVLHPKLEYATTPYGQPELHHKQPEYVSTPHEQPELCPKPEYVTTPHGQPAHIIVRSPYKMMQHSPSEMSHSKGGSNPLPMAPKEKTCATEISSIFKSSPSKPSTISRKLSLTFRDGDSVMEESPSGTVLSGFYMIHRRVESLASSSAGEPMSVDDLDVSENKYSHSTSTQNSYVSERHTEVISALDLEVPASYSHAKSSKPVYRYVDISRCDKENAQKQCCLEGEAESLSALDLEIPRKYFIEKSSNLVYNEYTDKCRCDNGRTNVAMTDVDQEEPDVTDMIIILDKDLEVPRREAHEIASRADRTSFTDLSYSQFSPNFQSTLLFFEHEPRTTNKSSPRRRQRAVVYTETTPGGRCECNTESPSGFKSKLTKNRNSTTWCCPLHQLPFTVKQPSLPDANILWDLLLYSFFLFVLTLIVLLVLRNHYCHGYSDFLLKVLNLRERIIENIMTSSLEVRYEIMPPV